MASQQQQAQQDAIVQAAVQAALAAVGQTAEQSAPSGTDDLPAGYMLDRAGHVHSVKPNGTMGPFAKDPRKSSGTGQRASGQTAQRATRTSIPGFTNRELGYRVAPSGRYPGHVEVVQLAPDGTDKRVRRFRAADLSDMLNGHGDETRACIEYAASQSR